VHEDQLAELHRGLVALGLDAPDAGTIHDVTSCPGAETCNLAVTGSRELASAITARLEGEGAVADVVPAATPGGAELVHLRHDGKAGQPKVLAQPPLETADDGSSWVDTEVASAVNRMVLEQFPPLTGAQCRYCQVRSSCPAVDDGRQVVR